MGGEQVISVTFTDGIDNVTSVKSLYQWDVGQTLQIDGLSLDVAPKVHFATKVEDVAYVVQSELSNGKIQVVIPDKVLSVGYPIIAYIYYEVALDRKTIKVVTIPVIKRQKPADWVDTTPSKILEVKNYLEKIEGEIDVLDADYQAFKALVNSYAVPTIRNDLDVLTDRVNNLATGYQNKTTTFNSDGSIVTRTSDTTTTTIFNSDGTITETIVKGDVTVVRTIYFDADGTIREVIT